MEQVAIVYLTTEWGRRNKAWFSHAIAMKELLRKPPLGGKLAILNGLLWVGLVVSSLSGAGPSEVTIAIAMVLSLPIALPFILPTLGHQYSEAEVIGHCIIIGINTLAWGYGLSWLWENVCRRRMLPMLLVVAAIIAGLFGFFSLL